jgi:hypothetical protein
VLKPAHSLGFSSQQPPAVDVDGCTGHESGDLAGNESDHPCNFLWFGKAAGEQILLGLIERQGGPCLPAQLGQRHTRRIAVHADPRGQGAGGDFGQIDQAQFCRRKSCPCLNQGYLIFLSLSV